MSKKNGAKAGGSKSGATKAKKPTSAAARAKPSKHAAGRAAKAKSGSGKGAAAKPAARTSVTGKSKSAAPKAGTGGKAAALSKASGAQHGARTMAAKSPSQAKTGGLAKKTAARLEVADIVLPPGYRPSEDEPFMNEKHRAYFRRRLMEWKDEILRQTRETLAILHEDSTQHADLADRATSETDRATELRTRDRQRKLIAKIDAALSRIEEGTYGYCEDTGEPIGLKRLDARPIATLSVEAQERHERREKVYREE